MNNLTKEEIKELGDKLFVISSADLSTINGTELYRVHRRSDDYWTQSAIWNAPIGMAFVKKGTSPAFQATHSYGHPSLFKPSIAEVLSAMPKEFLEDIRKDKCNAVEIIYGGYTEDNSKHFSIVKIHKLEKIILFGQCEKYGLSLSKFTVRNNCICENLSEVDNDRFI